jgi:beta-phosphoglucomutase
MRPRAGVIFDMDGVLIDSAAAHRRAWQQLGDEIGRPFAAELFQRTFGQRNASIIPTWLGAVSPERSDALGARKESIYRDLVKQGAIRVYPGIPALLSEIRSAGGRVAIASSGPRANVALLMDTIGAAVWVDATVSAEDVREGKPHPEVFLTAAERLGIAPGHCAVVEDSVHGIEAAQRAGMLAIAVLTSTRSGELAAAGADMMLGEVGELQVNLVIDALIKDPDSYPTPGSRSSRTGAKERR